MLVTINEKSKVDFIDAINSAYELQNPNGISEEKKIIKKIFNQTQDIEDKEILRLAVINGLYSTQAELSSLIDLSKKINKIEEKHLELGKLFVGYFKSGQKEAIIKKLFECKHGKIHDGKGRCEYSLISKYAYFLTDFEFPIYDRLMKKTLYLSMQKGHLTSKEEICKDVFKHDYFQYIYELSLQLKDKNAVDRIDAFGWATGKLITEQERIKEHKKKEAEKTKEKQKLVKPKIYHQWREKETELEAFKEKLKKLKLLDSI